MVGQHPAQEGLVTTILPPQVVVVVVVQQVSPQATHNSSNSSSQVGSTLQLQQTWLLMHSLRHHRQRQRRVTEEPTTAAVPGRRGRRITRQLSTGAWGQLLLLLKQHRVYPLQLQWVLLLVRVRLAVRVCCCRVARR